MLVIADAGPPHYLVLIGAIDVLPALFGTVVVPQMVIEELNDPNTPKEVREWIDSSPGWLQIVSTPPLPELPLPNLDKGERAAIFLAQSRNADLLLIDERKGRKAAEDLHLPIVGTLGILDRAESRGLVNFPAVISKLRTTNFRYPPTGFDELLKQKGYTIKPPSAPHRAP